MIAWAFVISGVIVLLIGFGIAETAYHDFGWKVLGFIGLIALVFGIFWGAVVEGWFA